MHINVIPCRQHAVTAGRELPQPREAPDCLDIVIPSWKGAKVPCAQGFPGSYLPCCLPRVYWWGLRSQTWEEGGEGGLYLTLHCHHHKDFCIRIGCDESCCNVLLIVSGKNHKKVSTDHKLRRAEDGNRTDVKLSALGLKPVLNWANVCSPNILRTVRRSMIRFLIELLVRRTWFRRFDELYFVLNWLVMSCKLRPELAADAQQTA